METADAWLRWTRAAALASVASLVAVWAHVGADGRLPSASVLLLVTAALTVAAGPLLAGPASALRVVLLTVGGQALAHAALSLSAGHRGDGRSLDRAHPTHPGRSHDHATGPDSGPGSAVHPVADRALESLAHVVADVTSAGAPMLLTHLAAAVLVGGWLAAGERAVWTMLTLAWRAIELLVAPVKPWPAPRPAPAAVEVAPLLRRVTAGSVVRRGPPLLLAA